MADINKINNVRQSIDLTLSSKPMMRPAAKGASQRLRMNFYQRQAH